MKTPLYAEIAKLLVAIGNCKRTGNVEWAQKHTATIEDLCRQHLPHGSGIDGDHCTLDFDASKPDRLVFRPADFHHMDENGSYDGWTEHSVIVKPSLAFGFEVSITGRDRNDIKEHLHFAFYDAMATEIDRFEHLKAEYI